ncbi:unnamed protein product [Malassezia sympodialis ATCC 42132]|uniref:uncharacterized protein n=1 Tax=Malassezia sympodialis (strain ATCC 42132) TaxID=1230383 RepID=UPI0002C214AA|nr:uncharacterized protein MSY001_1102 [Malassezia sympodialis ATCC 42132]CCU98396.1 unnamed protein product [Malassezia sympodialis ATCC 42132]|eukprot:XP_018739703.1 uncharacterized protein MSY001_1102 [Malassezia sympodialis ATCC 42132]
MSMCAAVGLNTRLPNAGLTRMLVSGARGFHAGTYERPGSPNHLARPLAVAPTQTRTFGGPLIHPGGSYIKGTVNEPTEYPKPNAVHGSYHWAFERLISVALVPMIAVATVKHGACGTLDGVLSATLLLHSHIGFDSVLVDYLDKRKFPVAGPVSKWILRAATVATACVYDSRLGLPTVPGRQGFEQTTNRMADDIGLTELVAKLWMA